ncbi:hypothetical protein ACM26W_14285 [Halomonas sp. HK25]|uniref:hypothetical protein n=1 Tax=Halomonas sp. HK25 TaxID=3394321 RepID=UPI0039FBD1E9
MENKRSRFNQLSFGFREAIRFVVDCDPLAGSKLLSDFYLARSVYLPHPVSESVETYCYKNEIVGLANVLYFCDGAGGHRWAAVQVTSFINVVYIDGDIYVIDGDGAGAVNKALGCIDFSIDMNNTVGRFGGFLIGHARPYHYIYDQMASLVMISRSLGKVTCARAQPLFISPGFLGISGVEIIDYESIEGEVFIYPCLVRGSSCFNKSDSEYLVSVQGIESSFRRYVIGSMCGQGVNRVSKEEINVYFGITGQKRKLINQVEVCSHLHKELSNIFAKVNIFVDGLTAKEGEKLKNVDDQNVFFDIVRELGDKDLTCLVGMGYHEKVAAALKCDLFVANAGSGCIAPLRLARIPGVLHSNKDLSTFPNEYNFTVINVDDSCVLEHGENKRPDARDYSILKENIFDLVCEVIKIEKNS